MDADPPPLLRADLVLRPSVWTPTDPPSPPPVAPPATTAIAKSSTGAHSPIHVPAPVPAAHAAALPAAWGARALGQTASVLTSVDDAGQIVSWSFGCIPRASVQLPEGGPGPHPQDHVAAWAHGPDMDHLLAVRTDHTRGGALLRGYYATLLRSRDDNMTPSSRIDPRTPHPSTGLLTIGSRPVVEATSTLMAAVAVGRDLKAALEGARERWRDFSTQWSDVLEGLTRSREVIYAERSTGAREVLLELLVSEVLTPGTEHWLAVTLGEVKLQQTLRSLSGSLDALSAIFVSEVPARARLLTALMTELTGLTETWRDGFGLESDPDGLGPISDLPSNDDDDDDDDDDDGFHGEGVSGEMRRMREACSELLVSAEAMSHRITQVTGGYYGLLSWIWRVSRRIDSSRVGGSRGDRSGDVDGMRGWPSVSFDQLNAFLAPGGLFENPGVAEELKLALTWEEDEGNDVYDAQDQPQNPEAGAEVERRSRRRRRRHRRYRDRHPMLRAYPGLLHASADDQEVQNLFPVRPLGFQVAVVLEDQRHLLALWHTSYLPTWSLAWPPARTGTGNSTATTSTGDTNQNQHTTTTTKTKTSLLTAHLTPLTTTFRTHGVDHPWVAVVSGTRMLLVRVRDDVRDDDTADGRDVDMNANANANVYVEVEVEVAAVRLPDRVRPRAVGFYRGPSVVLLADDEDDDDDHHNVADATTHDVNHTIHAGRDHLPEVEAEAAAAAAAAESGHEAGGRLTVADLSGVVWRPLSPTEMGVDLGSRSRDPTEVFARDDVYASCVETAWEDLPRRERRMSRVGTDAALALSIPRGLAWICAGGRRVMVLDLEGEDNADHEDDDEEDD